MHHEENRQIEFIEVYISLVQQPETLNQIIDFLTKNIPLEGQLRHLKRIKKIKNNDFEASQKKLDEPNLVTAQIFVLICEKSKYENLENPVKISLQISFGLNAFIERVPKYQPLTKIQYESWTKYWPMTFFRHNPTTPNPKERFNSTQILQLKSLMLEILKENQNSNSQNNCVILDKNFKIIAKSEDSHQTHLLHHCTINALNIVSSNQQNSSNDDYYLCTEAIVIIVTEPCIMCSMALLHSRVGCVIYSKPNLKSGGLGSKFSIHCEKKLNHHFQVYSGFIINEELENDKN